MTLALFALAQSALSHPNCAYGKYSNYDREGPGAQTTGAYNVCGKEYVGDLGFGPGDQEGCGWCAATGIGLEGCTGRNVRYVHFQDPANHAEHLCFRDTNGSIIEDAVQHNNRFSAGIIKSGCENRAAICMPTTVEDASSLKAYAFVCEPNHIWKATAGMNPRVAEFEYSLLGCDVDDNGINVLSHGRGKCIETPTKDALVATNTNFSVTSCPQDPCKAYDTVTVTCQGGKYFDPETFGSFVDKVEFVLALVGEDTVDWRINHNVGKDTEITPDIIKDFCSEETGCTDKTAANYNPNVKTALDGGGCLECTTNADCKNKTLATNVNHTCEGKPPRCKPHYTSVSAKNEMPFGLSSSVFFGLSVAALILCCLCLFCIGKRFIVGKDITSQEWNAQSSFGAGGSKSSHSRGGKSRRPAAE